MRIDNFRRGLSVLLLGCVAFLCCGSAHAAGFGYRRSITIDQNRIGSGVATTLSDYAMLVDFTSASLKLTPTGRVTSSSGYDIVFRALDTATCNGPASCTLSHELVSYSTTTGRVVAWVRIPSVNTVTSVNGNTVIYVYYGNSSITTSTARKTDVWKNYAAVWHLDETGSPATSYDSTSNARNGTTAGSPASATSQTPGVLGRELGFDGVNDTVSTSSFLSGSSTFTVEGWFYVTTDSGPQTFVGKSNTNTVNSANYVFSLSFFGADPNPASTTNYLTTVLDTSGGVGASQNCIVSGWDMNGYHHAAFTYDGSNVKVYFDGDLVSACTYAKTGTLVTTATPVTLGALTSTGTRFLTGGMDEVRISTVARDADYFVAVYNGQQAPTFSYTAIGSEVVASTAGKFGVEFLGGRALTLPDGQVLLGWETGLEQDNLGFQVVREQGGVFSQVTKDLVGGSLLRAMVGGNGNSPYFWLDGSGWGARGVHYFVDDVDAQGKATRHGPFAPTPPTSKDDGLMSAWTAQERAASGDQRASGASGLVGASGLMSEPSLLASAQASGEAVVARSMEFAPSAGPALIKLGVVKDGWQRVTGAELAAQGFPLGVASNQVAVLKDGADISRVIADGGDGTLDAEDTLEFWGLGEPGIYANEGVYAVSWEGPSGRNVLHSGQAPPAMSALGPSGFSTFGEYAEKKFYLAALNNGPADNFLGPVIKPSSLTVPLAAPDALSAADARLLVNLQGTSLLPHQVEVAWNGVSLGSVDFANREAATFESAIPEVVADNTLTLTGKAGMYDYSAIVDARVFYQRAYKALNEQLRFTALGGDRVTLGAFTQPGIRVLDVTNAAAPLELSVLEFGSAGALSGKVTVPGAGTRELYAFTPSAAAPPAYVKRYKSSALRAAGPADLVILSHSAFIDRLAPLVAQREREDLRVVVDDVDAIYDDFGRGRKDPAAIRESLRWRAAQGKPAKYLLLVGDGTFDPHNYLGKNVEDFVPVPTTNTSAFETAYDDYYGDLNEDGKPDVAVGRLPVRTAGDLDIAIEKLLRYAAALPEWPLDVLLVSGEDPQIDVAKIGHDGLGGEPLSVFEQPLISTTPKAELLQSLTEPSSRLVTYIGHGSTQVWGNGSAFGTSDAVSLSRTGPPSVFTLLTCLNGFFSDIYGESVAEGLLRAPNGAAVSVWAAPAMADSDDLGLLYHAFISEWTSGRVHTLGELVQAAKRNVVASDTERSMALLGDPSLKLALPTIAQTRSDALAHAIPPPAVTQPLPTPDPTTLPTSSTPTASTPPPRAPVHTLLTAANQRRLIQGAPPSEPEATLVGAAIEPANGQIISRDLPPSARDDGPACNHCTLTAGGRHNSGAHRMAGGLLALTLAAAFAGRRVRRTSAQERPL